MAYIAPNSDVYLLQNVPLSKDYENTILFSTAAAQANYFISKCPGVSFSFTDTTFVRQLPGSISLEIPAESAMLCNYMMYRNTSYGNKWFYAFIDSVEYVSNSTSRINFTLDVIQTWHFDYQLTDVFLERNHTSEDYLGLSTTKEQSVNAEYVDNEIWMTMGDPDHPGQTINIISSELLSGDVGIVLAWFDSGSGGNPTGQIMQGLYTTLKYRVFRNDGVSTAPQGTTITPVMGQSAIDVSGMTATQILSRYILALTQSSQVTAENIQSLYMIPLDYFGGSEQIPIEGMDFPSINQTYTRPYTIKGISIYGYTDVTGSDQRVDLNGYIPKNMKMYTYPYNYIEVANGAGTNLALRYERFLDSEDVRLKATPSLITPVSVVCEPCFYNFNLDAGGEPIPNHDYQIMLQGYPQCSWISDSYAAWQAQQSISSPARLFGAAGAAGAALMMGNPLVALGAGVGALISNIVGGLTASQTPDRVMGNDSSGNGALAQNRCNFYVKRKSLDAEHAKLMDDYFTMFGYSIGALYHHSANDDPRDHRPHYSYIKTVGSDITGTLPAEDARQINSIYDKGIRWWKVPSEVGDYSVDNSPST